MLKDELGDKDDYEQIYRTENDNILVKCLKNEEIIAASKVKKTDTKIVTKTFERKPKNDTRYKIEYQKLSENPYVYFPTFKALKSEAEELRKQGHKTFSLDELLGHLKAAEEVTLKKELDRANLFHEELQDKLQDLDITVIREFGENNKYSKCGKSKIDIVLLRSEATRRQQGVEYTAGALLELKTTAPKSNLRWSPQHSQTAHEMLKLATDITIHDKLSHGEDVDAVIVHGILVYMDSLEGVVMELKLDFKQGTSECSVDDNGRTPLEEAFPLVMGKLMSQNNS